MDTKFASFVGRRRDDPALPWASPDDDRVAPQVRIVALFNRRVKRIHVDMEDGAGHGATVTMHRWRCNDGIRLCYNRGQIRWE